MTTSTPDPTSSLRLARRLGVLSAEGSFRVAADARALEAAGRDVIHLEFGEPDFPSPPHVVEAAIRALRDGATKYATPAGLPALRAAIAAAAHRRDIAAEPANVIVTSGAKPMLMYAMLALVDDGDEVLVPDPGFPIYPSHVRLAGGVPTTYPIVRSRRGWELDVDALRAAVTPRTRVLMVNSPHNPTGWTASPAELLDLANVAVEHGLWIVTDEIYDGLTYGAHGAASLAALPGLRQRTVVVDGFSKRYAMTGWRLGFGMMPAELAAHVNTLIINNTSCAPAFVQAAGLAALEGPQDCIAEFRESFRSRRDAFVSALDAIPGLVTPSPDGAFYAFTDARVALARHHLTSRVFADRLLQDAGIAALPGTDFGPAGEGFLRFSFATAPELLARAAERMKTFVDGLDAPADELVLRARRPR